VTAAEILERVDADALPERVRELLAELGPGLVGELTYAEIAASIGRSEDYVGSGVKLIRAAIIAQLEAAP
jgi:DNA-directed RNA polymerase specialized sigma24 family protein